MIAVLFERFGPYHLARLEAAGRIMELTGVELFTRDKTYAWEVVEGGERFQRVRLFEGAEEAGNVTRREIIRRVEAALDRADPEAVAIPGWASTLALAALRWCLRRRRGAVVMSETTAFDAPRRGYKEAIKRRLVALFSAGLAGGRPHRDYLVELGLDAARVFTGYDAVDNDYFAAQAEAAVARGPELRGQLGLPDRYFLASNRFVEKKNLPRLLAAYADYRRRVGEGAWSLVLMGDGPLRDSLERQRASLGLESEILLPGFKQYDELPGYYALASGFVHASTTEQWGLVVNEAMASGLPVLVSNRCGCAVDLVTEGRQGWTFDPSSQAAITEALGRLAGASADDRAAMGRSARERVAAWSPAVFGASLRRAVEAAQAYPPPRFGRVDQLLLEAMLRQ